MMMRNRILPTLLLFSLLAACRGGEDPATTGDEPGVLNAATALAERLEVARTIEVYGTVEADRTAAVAARVMAVVTAVHVAPGDAVSRGQLLLEIDPQAVEGQLSQARGALSQAQAALALAQRNRERYDALEAADAASELELDMARMQHEQALGAVEQARGAVQAAAALAADSRVVAPFAGRVTRKMVEVGDLAAPGRPLLSVESIGGRRLRLSIPEQSMTRARLSMGDEVELGIDSRPELGALRGTVVEITPGVDAASRSYAVEVELPEVDVASGSAGRASIVVGRREVVAVPSEAVIHQGGLALVVERDPEGRAVSTVVTVGGAIDGQRVEVLSGLEGGETVLTGLKVVPPRGTVVSTRQVGS